MVLGLKIAFVWMVGLLTGWLLRIFIPQQWYIFTTQANGGFVYPANRVAFWLCLVVASLVTTAWVIRLGILDLRVR